MSGVPLLFQLHALSALLLFGAWPFTRLVHMRTAPPGHLTRPCIVHRSREAPPRCEAAPALLGAHRVTAGAVGVNPVAPLPRAPLP